MPGKIHRQCVENSYNATENFKTVHSRHISVNGNDLYLHVVTFQRVPKGRHWSSMPEFAGKKKFKKKCSHCFANDRDILPAIV